MTKLINALPWLARYPFVRGKSLFEQTEGQKHIIFTIANHFEPAWEAGGALNLDAQRRRLDDYHKLARKIGETVTDSDGTKFRHTHFYPAEQYNPRILDKMAEMQAEGLGEVEIHLHHGVEKPDTAENLRKVLTDFRDCLAAEHKCLSRFDERESPRYAFVHGNLALGNSCGGKFCGVDEEMQILADTGCYADFTLPSAPDQSQVPMLNQIYECGLPLDQKMPHRKGRQIAVFKNNARLPLIFTGPLVFNWTRHIGGFPVPRIDDGALVENQPLNLARLNRWLSANITVKGRPEWVFVKLYCHGFFDQDRETTIGAKAARFFSEVIENGEKTNRYKVYFASAREAFNIVSAAMDGKTGSPGEFRDYRLKTIMGESEKCTKTETSGRIELCQ